jgi:hypothetical protein
VEIIFFFNRHWFGIEPKQIKITDFFTEEFNYFSRFV